MVLSCMPELTCMIYCILSSFTPDFIGLPFRAWVAVHGSVCRVIRHATMTAATVCHPALASAAFLPRVCEVWRARDVHAVAAACSLTPTVSCMQLRALISDVSMTLCGCPSVKAKDHIAMGFYRPFHGFIALMGPTRGLPAALFCQKPYQLIPFLQMSSKCRSAHHPSIISKFLM